MADPDPLSSTSVQFVLAVIELVLYGFSLLLFFAVLKRSFTATKSWSQINRRMLFFSCSLFVFQTMYTAVGIRRRYEGFVIHGDTYPGGLTAFFENVTTTEVLLRNVAWNCQIALGDAIMIWRAYVVWKSFKVVLLPIIVWVGYCVAAIGVLVAMHQTNPSQQGLFVDSVGPWSIAVLASTMVCNVLSTGLLALRLWKMEKEHTYFDHRRHSRVRPAMWIVIDTGLVYTVWVLIAFVTDILESRIEYLFDNSLPSVVSIVFYTILLRVSYHPQKGPRPHSRSSVDSRFRAGAGGLPTLTTFQGYEMQPQSISVPLSHSGSILESSPPKTTIKTEYDVENAIHNHDREHSDDSMASPK